MKIRQKKTITQVVDIGLPDACISAAGMDKRRRQGQKTHCDSCGKDICENEFVIAFKTGYPNMMLHNSCMPNEIKIHK